jgi:hypothetical protein
MSMHSSTVEATYHAAIDRLTPTEKVARGLAMLHWTRRWLGRQIAAERGPMPPERMRLEIARRLYQAEPATCRLIDAAIAELSADVSS